METSDQTAGAVTMDGVKASVLRKVDELFDEETHFLREMVRRPSLRGETNLVQQYIAKSLRGHGLSVVEEGLDLGKMSTMRGYAPVDWSYEGLVNVIGTARAAAPGGRSLILNGHVDVVPIDPIEHWSVDPWGGDVVGNRLYGRGSCDMKGGIAAAVYALRAVQSCGLGLKGEVAIETVIDEECSGNGTLSAFANGHTADAAIIPEPFPYMVTASTGVIWCRIRIRGRGAHAQSASSAVNPIEKAYVVIKALRELETELNRPEHRHSSFAGVEHPCNVNIGMLHSGTWPSSVPETCMLHVRIGYQPGIAPVEMQERIRQAVLGGAQRDEWLRNTPPHVEFAGFLAEGWLVDTESEIFTLVERNHEQLAGAKPPRQPVTGTADNRYFGFAGIPHVGYGPYGELLHAPDEWVDLESVRLVTRVLATTIIDWVGVIS
ncbi:ArgE/DapE family deacylase [bacterium]|nr:MAG: ArgE/DapE family deacylase [bacterium]